MSYSDPSATLTLLSEKLAGLKDPETVEKFFRAFFTPKECQTLCGRYLLIEGLLEGRPQRQIAEELGVSISQISRGSAELQFGVGREFFPEFVGKAR